MKRRAGRWRFSTEDIAHATGRGIWSVRKDRQKGLFDPSDLLSLSKYVVKHQEPITPEARRRIISGLIPLIEQEMKRDQRRRDPSSG